MKNPIKLLGALFFFGFIMPNVSLAAEGSSKLDLTSGTMTLSGKATFEASFDDSSNKIFDVNLRPEFGYFFFDQLEFSFGLIFGKSFGTNNPLQRNRPLTLGVSLGATYYFPAFSRIVPFMRIHSVYEAIGITSFVEHKLKAGGALGILITLANNWAASIEIPLNYELRATAAGGVNSFRIPMGFVGLKGFF